MGETNKAPMTSRIYEGYLRRYKNFCDARNLDFTSCHAFQLFSTHLKDDLKHSPNYIRNISNVINQTWFHHTTMDPKQKDMKDCVKTFTQEQLDIIRKYCQETFQYNELTLFILLVMDTNLKPHDILQIFNNPEKRKNYLKMNSDHDLIVFLESLPNSVIFPKKLHSYLYQFKNLAKRLLGEEELDVSFQMLKRSLKTKTRG